MSSFIVWQGRAGRVDLCVSSSSASTNSLFSLIRVLSVSPHGFLTFSLMLTCLLEFNVSDT